MKLIMITICVLLLLGCASSNKMKSCPDGKRFVLVSPYKLKGNNNNNKNKGYKYKCEVVFDKNRFQNEVKKRNKGASHSLQKE